MERVNEPDVFPKLLRCFPAVTQLETPSQPPDEAEVAREPAVRCLT